MLTPFDKALVPIGVALLTWLNQKYGLKFDASPETVTAFVGIASALIVYFIPNKKES